MVTPMVTVFLQGLSHSAAATMELLGHAFAGIVVSDRFAAYNHLPIDQRQLCWAHLIRDLTAIEQRPGASGEIGMALLALQRQLFEQWNDWKVGQNNQQQLRDSCLPIRLAFEATLQRVVDLGCGRGERTPWAQTVSICRQLAQCQQALWTFLEKPEIWDPHSKRTKPQRFSSGLEIRRDWWAPALSATNSYDRFWLPPFFRSPQLAVYCLSSVPWSGVTQEEQHRLTC